MRKYIFLSTVVSGIGGGQIYAKNKAKYLLNKGYEVLAISYHGDKNENIDFLKQYVFAEIEHLPSAYSVSKQRKIIDKIIFCIHPNSNDEIVIESNNMLCALWAEMIAERLKCKHIIFSISERNAVNDDMAKFLEFKFNRGELATIAPRTFSELFEKSSVVKNETIPVMNAFLGDNIADYYDERLDLIQKKEFNFCIIGRAGKSYVKFACEQIVEYCKKHPQMSFSLGLVSKFEDEKETLEMNRKFTQVKNLTVYQLGYFSPMPKKLFSIFDLYIGGAGCASLCYRQKCLTLALDMSDSMPLGLMGYDVLKTSDYALKGITYENCFDSVIFTKEYQQKEYIPAIRRTSEEAFAVHDAFLNASVNDKYYFKVSNIKASIKAKIKANFPFLIKIYRRIKG
ncbi:MAG: glycosyltransferase family 4 protein [Clostridiales bacterium]|nr:glycosyltransferase family 4 protein [Clostridiales bacterium]